MRRVVQPCWVLYLLLAAASPVNARAPSAELAAQAGLSIEVDKTGAAHLSLALHPESADPARMEQALGEALDCRLQLVTHQIQGEWWVLHARCDDAFQRRGLSRQAELNATSLLQELRRLGIDRLTISVYLPRPGFIEGAREDTGFNHLAGPAVYHSYEVAVDDPDPVPLRFGTGYRPEDLLRFAPLLAVLLLPVGLTVWRRWRALRSPADRFAVWFGHWRFHQRLVLGIWCLWWLAISALDVTRLTLFTPERELRGSGFATLLLFCLLPPVVILCLCKGLSAPVFAQVPEAGWTRRNVWRQALWGLLAVVCLVVFGLAGMDRVGMGQTRLAGLMFLLAVVGGMVGLVLWTQARNTMPGPLPKGELRSRVHELAEKAAARIQQVYLLPAARWRLVNAFAWPGGNVHLTAALLDHLSKREVDALVAQEMTFLWRHRVRTMLFPIVVIGMEVLVGAGLGGLAYLGVIDFEHWWLLLVLPSFAFLPLFNFRLRRFAPSLDASAAALTGDPEALITALHKLEQHELLPLYAGPRQTTPTALLRRLETIAEREDIPPDRLQEILDGPGTGAERYTALPTPPAGSATAEAGGERFFSPALRKRVARRLNWMLTSTFILTPALAGFLAEQTGVTGIGRWGCYAGGLGATLALYYLIVTHGTIRTFAWLRRQLEEHWQREGIAVKEGGVFVGLAPEPYPRLYESFYDWDVGFLILTGDRLCYMGEQARFALDRGQVTAVRYEPGAPSWFRTRRVYVAWRDEAGDTGGTFSLRPASARSPGQSRQQAKRLFDRLGEWWTYARTGEPSPAPLAGLTTPAMGLVTGTSPKTFGTPQVLIGTLIFLESIAVAVTLAFGLSFEAREGAGAWYVLAVVALMAVVQLIPHWRYRDPGEERENLEE